MQVFVVMRKQYQVRDPVAVLKQRSQAEDYIAEAKTDDQSTTAYREYDIVQLELK